MKEIKGLRFCNRWVFVLVLLGLAIPLSAQATGIDFSIRFYDRRIYYTEGDPVLIQVTIANNSPSTYRFKLADERVFSIDFDVRTVNNRPLETADTLIRKRTQSQHIYFREIAVESGESFSFVEDLRGYVKLDQPGAFVVRASMYPELIRSSTATTAGLSTAAGQGALESQRLSLNVRPPVVTGPDGIPLEMDVATGAVLVRQQLAPDKVVDYMLTARQRSQWERFFLYLDLEAMLARDAVSQRKWLSESEEGRRRMVALYRQELQNDVTDGSISVIPSEFVIERTQYDGFEGSVIVLQKFRYPNFTERKRYTYYLRLKDNVWTIVDYSVINLGTE
ncbi:MAG: hypothetical protein LBQ69_00900 [Treponema sp.]|jgi:hypothetical protein|nr:hypothetical protein [Treponema sp.]